MDAHPPRPAASIAAPVQRTSQQVVLPDNDLTIRDLISVFRRGKGVILLAVFLGILLAIVATILSHKMYSATSTIELTRSAAQPLGLQDLSGLGEELSQGEGMNSDLLTQLTVISSDTTALAVIEQLNLQNRKPFAIPDAEKSDSKLGRERGLPLSQAPHHRQMAIKGFQARLKVEVVKGTRLIAVTYTDEDPAMAAQVANEVVDASIALYTDERVAASNRASQTLLKQLEALKEKVAQSQAEADAYQKESGLAGMTTSSAAPGMPGTPSVTFQNLPMERLVELNRDLANAKVVTAEKEAIYNMAQLQDPAVVIGIGSTSLSSGSVVGPGSPDLALLQALRQRLAVAEVSLTSASAKYGAKNPTEIRLQSEVSSVRDQIAAEMKRIKDRSLNDLQVARNTEEALHRQVVAQQNEVAKVGGVASKLIVLQQQAEADRNLYQTLTSKREEANAVAGLRSSNISIVDRATVQPDPVAPKPTRNLAFGLVGGFVLGTILAFAQAFMSDYVHESGDVLGILPAPVLGTVPDFRSARSRFISGWKLWSRSAKGHAPPTVVLTTSPQSSAAEAYRLIRTSLLQSSGGNPPKSVLFMSGSDGEGRSTTCANTAAAFASQGYSVLLVDADMRSVPEGRLVPPGSRGLSTCLADPAPPESFIQPYADVPNLSVLPAGPLPPNPSELLGDGRFKALVEELEGMYDFIFFDSPPALSVADARVIAMTVQSVVVVVRAEQTRSSNLRDLAAWMRSSGCLPLGACLNAVDLS